MAFNHGKPYHGSETVEGGRLTGATDQTDYFYFICPRCSDRNIMRILDHGYHEDPSSALVYPDLEPKQVQDFVLVFTLYCPSCKLKDFVKLGNTGRQGGSLDTVN